MNSRDYLTIAWTAAKMAMVRYLSNKEWEEKNIKLTIRNHEALKPIIINMDNLNNKNKITVLS